MNLIFLLLVLFSSDNINIVDCKKISKSICNSDTHKYLATFMIQNYLDARKILGLSNYYSSNPFYYSQLINNVSYIYTYHSGTLVTHNQNGLVPYARIYKCGNEAIGYNLDSFAKSKVEKRRDGQWKIRRSQSLVTKNQLETYLSVFMSLDQVEKIPIFTFVRDPIEHFISGFTELMFRTYNYPRSRNYKVSKDGKSHQMTKDDSKNMMIQIFNFDEYFYEKQAVQHLFPMSPIFFEFDIDIIGHLEHFAEDWENKIVPTYNITEIFNTKLGTHDTSQNHPWVEILKKHAEKNKISKNNNNDYYNKKITRDPNNARTSLKELLKTDKSILKAICHFVLVDYICIPTYSLPEECQFLNKTVELAKINLINHKIVPKYVV